MKDLEAGPGEATEDLASRKRHPSGQMTGVAPGDGPFRNPRREDRAGAR